MRHTLVLLAALTMGAPVLAGCVSGGDDADEAPAPTLVLEPTGAVDVITDAAGDATLHNSNALTTPVPCFQLVLPPEAAQACWAARSSLPHAGGTPAPPAFDALGVTFAETSTDLLITFAVGEVDEAFADAAPADGSGGVSYIVCWYPAEWDTQCAYLDVYNSFGTLVAEASYEVYTAGCNDWWWCSWRIPHRLVAGTPGQIELAVPRAIMPNATVGDTIETIGAQVWAKTKAFDGMARVQSQSPVPLFRFLRGSWPYIADSAGDPLSMGLPGPGDPGTSDPFTFAIPAAPPPAPATLAWSDSEGDAPRPDLDILGVELAETPEALVLSVRFAEVEEQPARGQVFDSEIGLPAPDGGIPGGRVYEVWFDARDGERVVGGGFCEGPQDDQCQHWIALDPPMEVHAGTPGWINISYPRRDLGSPAAGTLPNIVSVDMVGVEEAFSPPMGPVALDVSKWDAGDWAASGPPYWLRLDTQLGAPADEDAVALVDDIDDMKQPTIWLDANENRRFDVTFVDALLDVEPTGEHLKVTLGVADLRSTIPPNPYDAVLYAAAIDTSEGAVLLGYYRDQQNPAQLFCGPDTVLFAEDVRDPMGEAVTEIEGGPNPPRAGEPGRANRTESDAGTITFIAPVSCFGGPDALAAPVDIAAGTWVIRNPTGNAGQGTLAGPLDEAFTAAPVLIPRIDEPLAATAATPGPWYEEVATNDSFWNIAGILGAGGMAIGGVAAIRRKRSILRQYLHEVDHAAGIEDARRREAAFHDIRRDLKEDLVSGHISEGHYVIVERRLDEHLAKTRTATVIEAFGDLPHRLLARLQDMLADGTMTKEDYRLFSSLLEDTGLSKEAKTKMRRKLQLWVAEDAEVAARTAKKRSGTV